MEILLVIIPPVLFLGLAVLMIVVSQVSGFLTFMRYSRRQKESNKMIAGYLQGLTTAKLRLSQRAAALAMLSAKLKRSNDELANLNNLKTRFLSMAVHDLRTPIGAINGYADLLAQGGMPKKDRQYVQNILVATGAVSRLMGDLTDLAIIEAGKLRIEKAPFEAAQIVSDVIATHSPLAMQKGVRLESRAQQGLTIVGDRFRLGQVLANLVGNAIKFTPAGGLVRVSLLAGGGGALFAVSDTGPGIHPSERARIFDKFYQSKFNDPAAARKGWGLGLSIATEIVRGHQGELGVESAGLGKGSKFWFFVPARPLAQPGRAKAPRALIALGCALLALTLSGPVRAQVTAAAAGASPSSVIPIDDKARYDKFLEDKADSILMRMLGPNRAKVLVDATLDFTRTEKFTVSSGEDQSKDGASDQDILFAWQKTTATKPNQPSEFLPGIPMDTPGAPAPAAPAGPTSYEKQYAFPGSFVKKLNVTIIIDKDIPQDQSDTIERVVTNLLDLDQKRGDELTVIQATFAPAWKTIWYSQDSVSMVFKYAVLALMTMLTLIVIAWCFVKLAGAIETMAKAQTQQYAMDVGMKPELENQQPELPQLEPPQEEEEEKEAEPEEEPEIVIDVKAHQLDTLVEMLKDEDPENIALVSAYLSADMRKKFLNDLPAATQAEVIMNMANVRFVEQDMVVKIKTEIERRLAGAVGGLGRIYDMIETAPPSLQRQLLSELETKDPTLYGELRKHVLLMEDLVGLSPEEWSVLMGRTRIETWAAALPGAPDALKKAVESQVLPQTWMIVSQIMESQGVTKERIQQAQASLLDEARKLIDEGKIHNPTGASRQAELAAPAAAAEQPAASI